MSKWKNNTAYTASMRMRSIPIRLDPTAYRWSPEFVSTPGPLNSFQSRFFCFNVAIRHGSDSGWLDFVPPAGTRFCVLFLIETSDTMGKGGAESSNRAHSSREQRVGSSKTHSRQDLTITCRTSNQPAIWTEIFSGYSIAEHP